MSDAKPFKIFGAGVPTAPDVEKLESVFSIPPEGEVIPWGKFEEAIGLNRKCERFGTVIAAWRRRMFTKHNVVIGAERGKGLVHLPPNSRMECAADKTRSGLRHISRGVHIAATTDDKRLTPENRVAAQHFRRIGANVRLAMAASAKGIDLPTL